MSAVCEARRRAAGALCGLFLALPPAASASATAGFHVAVKMAASPSQGTCVSESLNESADFQVTCTSGQFVNISPELGLPFAGTPGGAFRYLMMRGAPGSVRPTGLPVPREPPASVTAMRMSSEPEATAGPVEILVSF
jgi:hypothetical protein